MIALGALRRRESLDRLQSVRGSTTLLSGTTSRKLSGSPCSEAGSTLDLFLKFEQLAGYSRYHVFGDDEFRGIDRVKQALARGSKPLLGASTDCQILSNQTIYGPRRNRHGMPGLSGSERPAVTVGTHAQDWFSLE